MSSAEFPEVIGRPPARGLRNRMVRSEAIWGYALIGPMLIGFIVFFLIALGASLVLSFTEWRMIESPSWIGLGNYRELLRDPKFRTALANTVAITIPYVILRLSISLAFAIALNSGIRFQTFYRLLFFLPVVTMPVSIGTIWKWLYDPAFGPINSTLRRLGLPQPEWLAHRDTAIIAVVIVLLWSGIGYDMIVFLAGLQTIPRDYYQASSLDGAGSWQQFRDITLPLLTPTTFFLSVIGIIYSLQIFDLVYVMTKIDQTNRLPTVVYYIYDEGFRNFRMGYAIASAWLLLLIILAFTIIQFRLQKRWVNYA
jgi:multiple sugar transport system permease protein